MTPSLLESLKAGLEQFGESNDSAVQSKAARMLNITRETGEFLAVMVQATAARRILEIGTSNGYSTLWLAEAARATGGAVTTLEISEAKIALAMENFERSGLACFITLVQGDAGPYLRDAATGSFDFIFLDSERAEYAGWWPALRQALRPGGLLVVDNAISHPEEMAPLVALVTADASFATSLVPIGKGEFMAVKKNAAEG